jgi:hypothetical protein
MEKAREALRVLFWDERLGGQVGLSVRLLGPGARTVGIL